MGWFIEILRYAWRDMIEVPWHHSRPDDWRVEHWLNWLFGWAWAISGLLLGALVAPMVVQWASIQWAVLADTRFQDWFVIAVAVIAGFFVQCLGWFLLGVTEVAYFKDWVPVSARWPMFSVALVLPLAGVVYGIFRYLTWVGAGQREVSIAFVGGLLVKTFLIPLIKGVVTGALLRWFMHWLRGGNDKKAA